jgi:hypothetical protein
MKESAVIKKILIITFALTTFLLLPVQAKSEEDNLVISRAEWFADDSIFTFTEDYSLPTKLTIVTIDKKDISSTNYVDIQELYYYFTTRSGLGGLPFRYIVDSNGQVYEGNKFGDEIKNGIENDSILIAYIQNSDTELSISSIDSLKSIVLQVINKYAISPENISIKNLKYSFGDKFRLEEIKLVNVSEEWEQDITYLKEDLTDEYGPSEISYKLELLEVTVPTEELEPTSLVDIKIKIKNSGDFNVYAGSTSNVFVTRTNPLDENSLFYISDEWDSLSRVSVLSKSERLMAGEEKEFTFKIYVPLYPPERSEDFTLIDPMGNQVADSDFKITLKIKESDASIIEITDTPTGYLNVRNTPGLGEVLTKVNPGERFIVLDYQNGYYKINANGKEGWVVNTYVKRI